MGVWGVLGGFLGDRVGVEGGWDRASRVLLGGWVYARGLVGG